MLFDASRNLSVLGLHYCTRLRIDVNYSTFYKQLVSAGFLSANYLEVIFCTFCINNALSRNLNMLMYKIQRKYSAYISVSYRLQVCEIGIPMYAHHFKLKTGSRRGLQY